MSTLKEMRKKKVHTRNIALATFDADEECIIVEGELKDERLEEIHHISGGKRPKGTIHHMKIRMMVGPPGLVIRELEAEMLTVPREECPETIESIQKVKGVSITTGYTARIKSLLGGKKGCAHLATLLIAMGPEAVQGYFANSARAPLEDANQEMKRMMLLGMKDTCHVWREDGPYYREMIDSFKKE